MSEKTNLPPGLYPQGLKLLAAAEYVGVSNNTLTKMVRQGLMPPPRCFGARRLWIRAELDAALLALPIAGPNDAGGAE